MIDVWINKRSGWIVESFESQYINVSTYRPLSGSSYMDLTVELRNPRKGLISIKNKDQKCFLSQKELKKNKQKKLLKKLDYDGVEFPVQEKILKRLR